eukprot:TRINITY_DN10319_c3_g1_i1.p1 TRINITY_DN10319_c3_g1~~TRINITY_DN10319_c3_g1_i1.p1  ORF type:complete len:799 (+),score=98.56 TRINITY_DN10319_c3_g1_i1:63-2459(+)
MVSLFLILFQVKLVLLSFGFAACQQGKMPPVIMPGNPGDRLIFSYPGDRILDLKKDVISGKIRIFLELQTEFMPNIAACARTVLASLCQIDSPVLTGITQDILTLRQSYIGVMIGFYLLPGTTLAGGGGPEAYACLDLIVNSQSDGSFMTQLGWAIKQDTVLVEEEVHTKGADVRIEADIEGHPVRMRRPLGVETPDDIAKFAAGSKPLTQEELAEMQAKTSVAVSTDPCSRGAAACTCGAIRGCKWELSSAGGFRCFSGANATAWLVTCEQCPMQDLCPQPDPVYMCVNYRDPCACQGAAAGCRWDEIASKCIPQDSIKTTSCLACARQPHCKPPEISSFFPPKEGTVYQRSESCAHCGIINLTFTKRVTGAGAYASFLLNCPGFQQPKKVPRTALKTMGQTVIVDVVQVENPRHRVTCSLIIQERAVVDQSLLPFLGLVEGSYNFVFPDTLGPSVTKFEPLPGRRDVQKFEKVILTWDSALKVTENFSVSLWQVGGGGGGGEGIDVYAKIATLGAGDPRMTLSGAKVILDFSEWQESNQAYTLELEPGSVLDMHANPNKLVSRGTNIWYLAVFSTKRNVEDNTMTAILIASLSVVGVLFGIGGAVMYMMWNQLKEKAAAAVYKAANRMTQSMRSSRVAPGFSEDDSPAPGKKFQEVKQTKFQIDDAWSYGVTDDLPKIIRPKLVKVQKLDLINSEDYTKTCEEEAAKRFAEEAQLRAQEAEKKAAEMKRLQLMNSTAYSTDFARTDSFASLTSEEGASGTDSNALERTASGESSDAVVSKIAKMRAARMKAALSSK